MHFKKKYPPSVLTTTTKYSSTTNNKVFLLKGHSFYNVYCSSRLPRLQRITLPMVITQIFNMWLRGLQESWCNHLIRPIALHVNIVQVDLFKTFYTSDKNCSYVIFFISALHRKYYYVFT